MKKILYTITLCAFTFINLHTLYAEDIISDVVTPIQAETTNVITPAPVEFTPAQAGAGVNSAGIQDQDIPQVHSSQLKDEYNLETLEELEHVTSAPAQMTEVIQSGGQAGIQVLSEESTFSDLSEVATSSTSTSATTTPDSIHVLIRAGEKVLFNGITNIVTGTTTVFNIDGVEHTIDAQSALGVLVNLDSQLEDFNISKIQYYESFDALYLKCVIIQDIELCDNWQYVLNSNSPWSSIEQTFLSTNDNFVFYFGSPYQLIVPEIVTSNQEFKVIAQSYDYKNNLWDPRQGVTIGVTVPDPNNPWSPIVLQTATSSEEGIALFRLDAGAYDIGVTEDYYFPLYSITSTTTSTSTTTATTTAGSSGGSGSSPTPTRQEFDIAKAFEFLNSVQDSKGTFAQADLYTDWTAIAFASANKSNSLLFEYLQSDAKIKRELTDNIRRTMVLLALDKNPYSFEGTNYIEAIVKEFDGEQFGESYLINDDIFAILVLQKSGYTYDDEIIAQTISFILSKQRSDGSWEASIDLTASAIQSLYAFKSKTNVGQAILKASNYIESKQNNTGGWTNAYDTSWAMQAMNVLGKNWSKNTNTPATYLATLQSSDGGVLTQDDSVADRVWATSYAIPAILQKSWIDILNSTRKQDVIIETSSNNNTSTTTESVVQSTDVVADAEPVEIIAPAPIVEITPNQMVYTNDTPNSNSVNAKETEEIIENKNITEESMNQEVNLEALANISDVVDSNKSIWSIIGGLLMLGGAGLILGRKFFV